MEKHTDTQIHTHTDRGVELRAPNMDLMTRAL